ncbi:MAG: GNAT family N-acetyltransferase [Terriglobia bacterium]
MNSEVEIVPAASQDEIAEARRLFEEYGRSLSFSLCFQGFSEELASLPGAYAPPAGRLLLARVPEGFAGCVALRPIDAATGEVKRLYVAPEFRKKRIGRMMAERVIEEARKIGYAKLRLDTLTAMTEARSLYRSLGFYETAPYHASPLSGTVYMELVLAPAPERV